MKNKSIDVTYTIKGGIELLLTKPDRRAKPSGLKSSSLAHLSKKEAEVLKDDLDKALKYYDKGAVPHPEDLGGHMAKKEEKKERATELEYLTWFRQNADFGPADGDVKDSMDQQFMQETGKLLPKGWNFDSEGNEI